MAELEDEELAAVSDFLDQDWDPIGVYGDVFGAADAPSGEYATYAPMILADLRSGADRDDVLRHLRQAREGMGLEDAPDRGRDVDVAGALVSWWVHRLES